MAELADNPRVAELLLLLWDAPDREAGIAIVDLPEPLREESLLSACEGEQLRRCPKSAPRLEKAISQQGETMLTPVYPSPRGVN